MIGEPLAPRWRYDLGHRKIYEFRSALGMNGEGPAPSSALFAYGIVPGLARILTHPEVATRRDELRLARIEAVFASELDMRGELLCTIEVKVAEDIASVISCVDERGARAVATVHLVSATEPSLSPPPSDYDDVSETLSLDPARCVAFAAATWDLNPAYWDRELAEVSGLGGLVAPPGLPLALTMSVLEERSGNRVSALDAHFDGVARPGETLALSLGGTGEDRSFQALSDEGAVVYGEAVLGHPGGGL